MNGNTNIGFHYVSVKAYCKRCTHFYKYGYNGCKPLSQNSSCPICGKIDEVETNHGIDSHISTLRMFKSLPETNKAAIQERIYELYKIKGELEEFE